MTDYCGSCSGEGAICPAGESWMTCGIEGSNRNFYLDVPSRTCKEQMCVASFLGRAWCAHTYNLVLTIAFFFDASSRFS